MKMEKEVRESDKMFKLVSKLISEVAEREQDQAG